MNKPFDMPCKVYDTSKGIFDENFKLTDGYKFSSSSTIASIRYGSNQNGKVWKYGEEKLEDYLKRKDSKKYNNDAD